jgi:hypothetical protein
MGGRLVVVLTGLVAAGLFFAPPAPADISLTAISPHTGNAESTVACEVTGHFPGAETPVFTLSPSLAAPVPIEGVTGAGWTAAQATVTFSLAADSEGQYDLVVQQGATWTAMFGCFRVYAVAPVIEVLEPSSARAGSADLTITVHGRNMARWKGEVDPGVCWDGVPLATTWVSASELTAVVPAPLLAAPGTAAVTVRRLVGGAVAAQSAPAAFAITAPTPTITALDRATSTAGAAGFDLGITGTGFLTGAGGAVVRWNDSELATIRDSATHLTAAVPASLLAAAGSASITVRNGAAGAPVSNAVPFTVGGALPVVTSVSPAQAWAGCLKTGVMLTVGGSGFVSGAHVTFGTVEKAATTFVSATQLTVPLLPADITTPGTIKVGVRNPPFPPGTPSAATQGLVVQAETTDPTVTISGADSAWHNAPVTLTFTAADTQSGVRKIQYMAPPGVPSWTDGESFTVPTTSQGHVAVGVQAFDWCDRAGTASAVVNIDTTRPETAALGKASVKKGKTAALRYRVSEPSDLSPAADVKVVIKRRNGSTAKTIDLRGVAMNRNLSCRFACGLRKGTYRWYVYATDLAGNEQLNVASASLKVK